MNFKEIWTQNRCRANLVRLVLAGLMLVCGCSVAMAQGDPAPPKSVISIIFSGGIFGVAMIVVLFALSLTAAYLVFDHLISVRRSDLIPPGLSEEVRGRLKSGDVATASQLCKETPSLLSFVLLHGISELEFGWASVEKAIEDALAEQSARLFRKIEYLSVIGNIAPMVGLLGTVFGMIVAFQSVAATQGTASAPQLAEGIYQALVTTVGGLIVAIPSIGAFAVFRNRIDQLVAEAAYTAQHVFTPLRRRAKK
jgi:biopolymer transport protein ExbB